MTTPTTLDQFLRTKAAEALVAEADSCGSTYVSWHVHLSRADNSDLVAELHALGIDNTSAPYYLHFTFDGEPQAISGVQDEKLLSAVDMNSKRTQQHSLLHSCQSVEDARLLLECGGDLDQCNSVGEPALYKHLEEVKWGGRPEAAEQISLYLIEQGADVSIPSADRGRHAIHLASTPRVLDSLLARGVSINQFDDLGQTVLHDPSSVSFASHLLDRGADPNARDQDGNTPLHYSTDIDFTALLLERGADPTLQNNDGQTAEQYLEAEGEPSVSQFVRSVRERQALDQLAATSRPQNGLDLADPEELADRRRRAM